jgi:Flp pilus assembly protein TadD
VFHLWLIGFLRIANDSFVSLLCNGMKRFFAAICLAAICLLSGFQACAQDDQYFRIYGIIQEGDGLLNASQPAKALAKYTEAQSLLQQFQRTYPDWNGTVVKFRLNYLSASISEISKRFPNAVQEATKPATKSNGSAPVKAEVREPSELESQLNSLQSEIRGLQNDKSLLESKLREAMRVQPTATDPRALAKAEQEISRLQRENALLNVNLAQRPVQTTPAPPPDAKAVDQLKKQLAEANRRIGEEAERASALAAEKAALQKKLAEVPKEWNATNAEDTRKALEESNRHLAEQMEMNNHLSLEKLALQNRVKTLMSDSESLTALRSENEILKTQLADLKAAAPVQDDKAARELDAVKAQMAVLKSDQAVLQLEKAALEKRIKEMATAKSAPAPAPAETGRIKQLESERDELQTKLNAAQKEIAASRSKNSSAQVDDLRNQIEILRTRLAVMEVQQVPLSEEELALLKKPEAQAGDPKPAKPSSRDLPSGSVALVAEAQRDFASRRFEQAEQKYQEVLKQDQKNVYTLANLAAIQLELNRLEEAEKNIQQALAVSPDDSYTLSLLGFLKFRQNKMDDALEALGRAAKLDPKNAEVQNYLGLVLSQKGMRKAAESALRKAIALDPNYASAHYNLAVICVTQRPPDLELARFHYKKALAAGLPPNADMEKMLNNVIEVAP